MWRKLDRLDGIFRDGLGSAEPVVCLLYEDDADRRQMLSRVEKARLGELPRVMIKIESQAVESMARVADARRRLPARVA